MDLNKDWMAYWRLVFPTVSEQAIDDFEKEYKGSEEEENDLVKLVGWYGVGCYTGVWF